MIIRRVFLRLRPRMTGNVSDVTLSLIDRWYEVLRLLVPYSVSDQTTLCPELLFAVHAAREGRFRWPYRSRLCFMAGIIFNIEKVLRVAKCITITCVFACAQESTESLCRFLH